MSTKNKPTQGQWYVDHTSSENTVSIHSKWSKENPVERSATFGDYRGSVICEMHYNTGVPTKEQAEANADFILPAINSHYLLLDALKEAQATIIEIKSNAAGKVVKDSPVLRKIKAAIAKAENK